MKNLLPTVTHKQLESLPFEPHANQDNNAYDDGPAVFVIELLFSCVAVITKNLVKYQASGLEAAIIPQTSTSELHDRARKRVTLVSSTRKARS